MTVICSCKSQYIFVTFDTVYILIFYSHLVQVDPEFCFVFGHCGFVFWMKCFEEIRIFLFLPFFQV